MAMAFAESRLARRLVRTWLFAALAVLAGLGIYHLWSGPATFGATQPPRFALPGIGLPVLWILLAGLVFLSFDIRARDERERVADVLDVRPVANLALLGGRLLAAVFVVWLPLAVLAVALQVSGMIVDHLDAPAGVPVEPISLLTLVFVDAPPALVFWGALVMLLAAWIRNRAVVSLIALALLAAAFWALYNTPLYLLPVVSHIANLGLAGSDILPRLPSWIDLVQRGSVLLLGGGLLTLAAALLPRRDGRSRGPYLASGTALLLAGGVGFGALVLHVVEARAERAIWADVHAALADAPRADLERLSGTVSIDPGRELAIAVELDIRAPESTSLTEVHFSLNPAMEVASLRLDGADVAFVHEMGLLTLPSVTLAPGSAAKVHIEARGAPDPRFGYLDSAVWGMDEPISGMPLVLMGEQASLFDARYVALMPTVRWLPMPGANFASASSPDFHGIDLVVELTKDWRVTGPGRLDDGGVLRFRPAVPLTEFPLLAGPFERRALRLGEVEYELLLHAAHMEVVEFFSDEEWTDYILEYLESRLEPVPGLPYPHEVLSLVEVPAQLRRYGGGRILDTVQAMPGVQMLPEQGFPTSRPSARAIGSSVPEDTARQMRFSWTTETGPHGVPVIAGASRNLVPFLSRASGEGADAVNYLMESLTAWRMFGTRTVAPAHWLRLGMLPGAPMPLRVMHRLSGTATFSFGWYLFFPMSLEDRSAAVSFVGNDARASEEGVDILVHKGNLIALAIQGLMGRERVAEFLALMRERHGGGTYGVDDFIAAMTETDPAMEPYIGHFLREVSLPGFLVSDPRVVRLPDEENGAPRYQVSVHLRNDEPVPGMAGLGVGAPPTYYIEWGDFVHVPGNTSLELGITSRTPPSEVRVETYLSQNARVMRLPVARVDSETVVSESPLIGARPSTWLPRTPGIVVDDLDPGFTFVSPPTRGFRLGFGVAEDPVGTDVPEFFHGGSPRGWHRQGDLLALSWGKYRRTLMRINAGTGAGTATFCTVLPEKGTWRLFYHLPGASASEGFGRPPVGWTRGDAFGTYHLEIVADEVRQPLQFDASQAIPGWNDMGAFDLPAGSVDVVVTDATDGEVVVADAIRWEPVPGD